MFQGMGATGIILLIVVALLLFGPSKLPELGRAFGKTLREFKNGAKDMMSDDEPERKDAPRTELRREDVKILDTPKNAEYSTASKDSQSDSKNDNQNDSKNDNQNDRDKNRRLPD